MITEQKPPYEQLESEVQNLQNKVSLLEEQLAWFKRQVFGNVLKEL